MTDVTEARAKVRAYLETDDFELVEFPQGWRVVRHFPVRMMGAGTFAVERSSGALLHFPSNVAPGCVDEEFEEFRPKAQRYDPPPPVTDEADARDRVRVHLGSGDFDLVEFAQGWRVVKPVPEGIMGTPTLVVERSGALLAFPPGRVDVDYDEFRLEARHLEPHRTDTRTLPLPSTALPGRNNNCGDCARASERTWRGYDTQSGALADPDAPGEPLGAMDYWSPGDRLPTTFDGIRERLETLGHGASALVAVYWTWGGGHWFNALNHNGVITAVNGQRGKQAAWPPTAATFRVDEDDCVGVEAIFVSPEGRHLTADDIAAM
jgi:hypothetical protein